MVLFTNLLERFIITGALTGSRSWLDILGQQSFFSEVRNDFVLINLRLINDKNILSYSDKYQHFSRWIFKLRETKAIKTFDKMFYGIFLAT